ncbi:MAG TPA: hypothetical protein VF173_32595 [Thermoanaerobaculia bacterium]|nr:hypothetical protein [Thermoanaerobaculia bacterium]
MLQGSLGRSLMTLLAVLIGATAVLCSAAPARAAVAWQPQDGDFQVNVQTPADQVLPGVVSDAAGNFVVVWMDKARGLFVRRFDAAGAPLTGEVRVDEPPIPASWLARQDSPRIAMDGNGAFVVVYSSSDGIFIRRFNSIAQSLDRIALPYNSTGELLLEPDAVYRADGSLEMVWRATAPGRTLILHQGLDPQGRPVRGAVQVNEATSGMRSRPRVALDPSSGDAFITWIDERETGNPDVWARRFDLDDSPRGPEFQVDVENNGNGEARSAQPLAQGDGGFSVVWSNFLPLQPAGANVEVRAQRFDAQGSRLGAETLVTGEGADTNPAAAVPGPHGNLLVLWPGIDAHGADSAVLGRLFDSSWHPVTEVFEVNPRSQGDQTQPAVTVDPEGRFVALWAGEEGETPPSDLPSSGIFGRRFTFSGCPASDTRLCLNGGRFQVEVSWKNPFTGETGNGHANPLTDDTGAFWFFGAANLELLVKVLDGRAVNGHFWVYSGSLSNVEYMITATDTVTGQVRTYHNPAFQFASFADVGAFPAAAGVARTTGTIRTKAGAPGDCAAGDPAKLCLASQFTVSVEFTDPRTGIASHGTAVPLTGDTGAFWFFGPENLELMIKVLDGRGVNGKFWVFFGALSDVDYTITVTRAETGEVKTYHNPRGTLASRADTGAF